MAEELTREKIQEIPADEATDALVAELVMGWERGPGGCWYLHRHQCAEADWSPTTVISPAWDVVEAVHKAGWTYFELHTRQGFRYWTAEFERLGPEERRVYCSWAETTPLAICRAALLTTLSSEVPSDADVQDV